MDAVHLGWLGAEAEGAGAAPGAHCTCRRRGKGVSDLIPCFGQRWGRIFPVRAEPPSQEPAPQCPGTDSTPHQQPLTLQMRYGDPGLPEKTAGSKDHWKRGNKLSVILLPGRPIELQRVPQGQPYIIVSSHGSRVM